MKYVGYLFFRFTVFGFRFIPFPVMYVMSDIVAFLLRKALKYRLAVVESNLSLVYPELTDDEKHILIKKIYKNLADITLEGIKGFSMSAKQITKRHKFINPAPLDFAYKKNKSVMLVTGHYGNWEWGAFSPNFFVQQQVIGFYKPLTNPLIDRYVVQKRAKSGTILADINITSKYYKEYSDKNALFLMAADQSPTKPDLAIWTEFLGVNTPCVHGIEKYLERHDLAVIYCNITRVKRGFYELDCQWITSPDEHDKAYGETTKIFMKTLEKIILKKPENWLWTHKRWKYKDYKK